MLSKGDDYPVHQRPEPLATAGSDRNFYDRYYFSGYSPDGAIYFVAALGVYPHLDLIDAAFMVQGGGIQESVIASRHLHSERMDTRVAPISVEVLEPLRRLAVRVDRNEYDIGADLVFEGLAAPIEEPRFIYRSGPRTVLDLTRMTQGGRWRGSLSWHGEEFSIDGWRGVRDRSWGVRPIGARDAQPSPEGVIPQWFWLWAPMQFEDHLFFFHTNDDAAGIPWNRGALLVPLNDSSPLHVAEVRFSLGFRNGTRQVRQATITGTLPDGRSLTIDLEVEGVVYLQGAGYNHPTWGHGSYHGEYALHHQRLDCAALDPNAMEQIHLQTPCRATLTLSGNPPQAGRGIFEQMLLGPHAATGLHGLLDPPSVPQ